MAERGHGTSSQILDPGPFEERMGPDPDERASAGIDLCDARHAGSDPLVPLGQCSDRFETVDALG